MSGAPAAAGTAPARPNRVALAGSLRAWLSAARPRWSRLQPLLPAFAAKLAFMARGAAVMALCASWMLHPATRLLLRGSILIPVAAVVAIGANLGATIVTSYRLLLGGIIALAYNCLVLAILPRSVYSAVAATTVGCFLVSFTELTVGSKRFAQGAIIVCLMQWWETPGVDFRFALEVSGCVAAGAALGILMAMAPAPGLFTATREVGSRLRLLGQSLRNQQAALAIAFTHTTPHAHMLHRAAAVHELLLDIADELDHVGSGAASPASPEDSGRVAGDRGGDALTGVAASPPVAGEGGGREAGAAHSDGSRCAAPPSPDEHLPGDGEAVVPKLALDASSGAPAVASPASPPRTLPSTPQHTDAAAVGSGGGSAVRRRRPLDDAAAALPPATRATSGGSVINERILHMNSLRHDEMGDEAEDELWRMATAGTAETAAVERAPLLRADIEDLHSSSREQLPFLAAAGGSVAWEPAALWDATRRWLARLSCGSVAAAPAKPADAGIGPRLQAWSDATVRLHRIVRAMIVAEASTRSSHLHAAFVRFVGEPLCELVRATTAYHLTALAYSARIRMGPTAASAVLCCSCHCGCGDDADGSGSGAATTDDAGCSCGRCGCGRPVALHRTVGVNTMCCGYPGETIPSLADVLSMRSAVEAALTEFFRSLQAARVQVLYDPIVASLPQPGAAAGRGAARAGTAAAALARVPSLMFPHSVADAVAGKPSPSLLASMPAAHTPDATPWRVDDLAGINAFLFFALRGVQMVMATAEATCISTADGAAVAAAAAPPQRQPASPPGGRSPATYSSCAWAVIHAPIAVLRWFGALLAIKPSLRALQRALRVAIAVAAASIIAITLQTQLNGSRFTFWAPVSVAFLSGGSDGGTMKVSTLRFVGTLVGATAGYLAAKIGGDSAVFVGVFVTVWVGALQYARCDQSVGYWALVAQFTAAIVLLGSAGTGTSASDLALVRIEQTILGITVYIVVANLLFPVTARQLVRQQTLDSLDGLRHSVVRTLTAFTQFVTSEVDHRRALMRHPPRRPAAAGGTGAAELPAAWRGATAGDDRTASPAPPPPLALASRPHHLSGALEDPTEELVKVDALLVTFGELLSEADAEPTFWRPPFRILHGHYDELAAAVRRAARAVRSLHQCLLSMRAQAQMHAERREALLRAHTARLLATAQASPAPATNGSRGGGGGGDSAVGVAENGTAPSDTTIDASMLTISMAAALRPPVLSDGSGLPAAAFRQQHAVASTAYYDTGAASSRGLVAYSPLTPLIADIMGHVRDTLALARLALGPEDENDAGGGRGIGAWCRRCCPATAPPSSVAVASHSAGAGSAAGLGVVGPSPVPPHPEATAAAAAAAAASRAPNDTSPAARQPSARRVLEDVLAQAGANDGAGIAGAQGLSEAGITAVLVDGGVGSAGGKFDTAPRAASTRDATAYLPQHDEPPTARPSAAPAAPTGAAAVAPTISGSDMQRAGSAAIRSYVSSTSGPAWAAMARLPGTVDAMLGDVNDYLDAYDSFMRTHIIAVVKLNARGVEPEPAPAVHGGAGRERAGTLIRTAAGVDAEIPAARPVHAPQLLLSNLDALCLNTASFALRELGEAVADVARLARRMRHAEAKALGVV